MCPVCDGTGVEMGGLGWLIWLKCRNCGLEWSVKREKEVEDDSRV